MINEKDNRINRVLSIYEKLMLGEVINKKEMADIFSVSEKSIQRDIEDIRLYLYEKTEINKEVDIQYNREKKGYCLIGKNKLVLRQEDALVITKILLESRALNKEEL